MKITERLTYLLIILGMISLNSYIVWWHSGHYDYLNERLEIINREGDSVIKHIVRDS